MSHGDRRVLFEEHSGVSFAPDIRWLVVDPQFTTTMTYLQREGWVVFKEVIIETFLGDNKLKKHFLRSRKILRHQIEGFAKTLRRWKGKSERLNEGRLPLDASERLSGCLPQGKKNTFC